MLSSELPCALAETGGQAGGALPFVLLATICLAVGVLLVLAARRKQSHDSVLRAFGAVALIGSVLLASGVPAPAAQASEAGKNCAQNAAPADSKPADPKPVVCKVLPAVPESMSAVPITFTEGDVTSMEDFNDTGQSGALGFGHTFEVTVHWPGSGSWVQEVIDLGGSVELKVLRHHQFVYFDGFPWPDFESKSVVTEPDLMLPLISRDEDTAAAVGDQLLDLPGSYSYADAVAWMQEQYLDVVQEPLSVDDPRLQSVASVNGMEGRVIATLPAQSGCAESTVSFTTFGPSRG